MSLISLIINFSIVAVLVFSFGCSSLNSGVTELVRPQQAIYLPVNFITTNLYGNEYIILDGKSSKNLLINIEAKDAYILKLEKLIEMIEN